MVPALNPDYRHWKFRTKKAAYQSRQVRIVNAAYQDIDDITDYIAITNLQPLNAIRVADAIFETIDRIALNPLAFRECEQIPTKTKMYRRAVCLSWLIIYKITSLDILILGIIHGSGSPKALKKLRKNK